MTYNLWRKQWEPSELNMRISGPSLHKLSRKQAVSRTQTKATYMHTQWMVSIIIEIANFAQQIFVKQGKLGVQKNMGEPGGALPT